jgi:hypothetical protein
VRRSERRALALEREFNYCVEAAARLHLDGNQELALQASNRAIDAIGKILKRDRHNREVIGCFAEALRDRVEIQRSLAGQLADKDAATAFALIHEGVFDARRALSFYDQLAVSPDAQYPLRPATVRITLAELQTLAGDGEAATQQAEAAIEDYRRLSGAAELARALTRYAEIADVMRLAGAAEAARQEAIILYRAAAQPHGDLWTFRFDPRLTWSSTPTFERYWDLARRLAMQLPPINATQAAEALPLLQDVSEATAWLVPVGQRRIGTLIGGFEAGLLMRRACEALLRQADWLRAADQPALADRYRRVAELPLDSSDALRAWQEAIAALRAPLQNALDTAAGR